MKSTPEPVMSVITELNAGTDYRQAKRSLQRDGAVVVRGLLSSALRANVVNDVYSLLSLVRTEVSTAPSAANAVDALSREIQSLLRTEPEHQSHIYDAINSMPSMHALASSESVLTAVRCLLSSTVSIHHRKLLLMAPPEGSWHVPSWHQDWYYNEGPPSTLTLYAPLQRTDLSNGGLTLALGQHPLYPHGDHDIGRPCKWHHIAPRTVDNFEQSPVPTLEPGDVLFFHSLVPHAAAVNTSNHMRFVVNVRYFDMTDDEFVGAGWRCGNLTHAREALSRRETT